MPDRAPPTKPRVLVADDSATMRTLMRGVLAASCEVIVAEDGRRALEKARASMPEVVLTDLHMPELDGLGLLDALKRDAGLRHIPVILVTSDEETSAVQCIDVGAHDYMRKAAPPAEVRARVQAAVRVCRLHRELGRQGDEIKALASKLENAKRQLPASSDPSWIAVASAFDEFIALAHRAASLD